MLHKGTRTEGGCFASDGKGQIAFAKIVIKKGLMEEKKLKKVLPLVKNFVSGHQKAPKRI